MYDASNRNNKKILPSLHNTVTPYLALFQHVSGGRNCFRHSGVWRGRKRSTWDFLLIIVDHQAPFLAQFTSLRPPFSIQLQVADSLPTPLSTCYPKKKDHRSSSSVDQQANKAAASFPPFKNHATHTESAVSQGMPQSQPRRV